MTKAELAREIGKNPASVRRLYAASANPELRTVVAIADALDARRDHRASISTRKARPRSQGSILSPRPPTRWLPSPRWSRASRTTKRRTVRSPPATSCSQARTRRRQHLALLEAQRTAPPPAFSGGGMWEGDAGHDGRLLRDPGHQSGSSTTGSSAAERHARQLNTPSFDRP